MSESSPMGRSGSVEGVLADLNAAITGYLRNEVDLMRLNDCRDRATRVLRGPTKSRARCDCGARTGFHDAACAVVASRREQAGAMEGSDA